MNCDMVNKIGIILLLMECFTWDEISKQFSICEDVLQCNSKYVLMLTECSSKGDYNKQSTVVCVLVSSRKK